VAVFGQLGDGAIVTGSGLEYQVLFWPEPTGYANATNFLTDTEYEQHIHYDAVSTPISELALITDGLQRIALDFSQRTPYVDFFRPLFRTLSEVTNPGDLKDPIRNFLDSQKVNERTDDDKTLVIACRHSSHVASPTA
jgi:hypothetical protein